ncbi:MAG: TorF family putative porin [Ramlibacter sp.]
MELKKTTQTMVLAALALSGAAFAQTPAPAAAPEPDYTFAFNVGAVTEYRYRGISQSGMKPALQGGIDFTHKSGFYLGTWGSTIKWIKDAGGDAPIEIDIYGGYKGTAGDFSYDVGVLSYQYPGHDLAVSPTTTEIYGAGTFGPVTIKYSHSLSNLFGFSNSKNSYYLEGAATFDLGNGWSLVPHIGYQKVKNNDPFTYTDYSLTLGKDFGNGFSGSAMIVGTDADDTLYVRPDGKFTGKTMLVVGVKYSF